MDVLGVVCYCYTRPQLPPTSQDSHHQPPMPEKINLEIPKYVFGFDIPSGISKSMFSFVDQCINIQFSYASTIF